MFSRFGTDEKGADKQWLTPPTVKRNKLEISRTRHPKKIDVDSRGGINYRGVIAALPVAATN